ncbi:MAG: glycerophosphodiester phosphodiesterase [Prevotellaceae bacterium]|jgi:glycerophosphoryl diester phosphodiesterase|nr:glycerophosphodiester phosphodiesterase [Prevotellaceae bacterium]
MKNILIGTVAVCAIGCTLASCDDQRYTDLRVEVDKVQVSELPADLQAVRDYVAPDAVIAHRGSTFWTPEETEAAYRWARETGADYLELDLQCSKDGVILALHDDNLKRTTDIESVYGEFIPATRYRYYIARGLDSAQAQQQLDNDKKTFRPYYAASYMYDELTKLNAGSWFNIKPEGPEQARPKFDSIKQYISTLEDVVRIAEGKKLRRNAGGERDYTIDNIDKTMPMIDRSMFDGSKSYEVKYHFEYDDEAGAQWKGNRPGIYPEFKESWLNPADMEQRVYNELDALGWNIITKPAGAAEPFYTGANNTVNVGRTNGKVILQTFALSSLARAAQVFGGKVPMTFLLWPQSSSLLDGTPSEYASSINMAIANKAHIIGPCIAGPPNNYAETNEAWQAYLIHKAGMLNHPYSFDTYEQMNKYYGVWDKGVKTEYNYVDENGNVRRYIDAMFTNHADATLKFYREQGKNKYRGEESAQEVLQRLGY